MIKDSTIFVGLGLGDKYSEVYILDEEEEMVEGSLIPTTLTELKPLPSGLPRLEAERIL